MGTTVLLIEKPIRASANELISFSTGKTGWFDCVGGATAIEPIWVPTEKEVEDFG